MADALSKWWDEDAERINKMAIAARKMAVKLPVDKEDRWEDEVEEARAFCPNGEGNGVTNSCGSKQGGAASIDYDKLIDRIASSPDGFTLDVRNVEQPDDGIMVSEFQNDSVRSMRINAATIRSASSAIKVREFINNNSDLLLGRNDRFLGGWLDGDDFYFDVATRFDPQDADKALETGRKSGQLAVFNLATFNTTYIHYEPEDSRKPKDWDERFDRAKSDLGDQGQELEKHGKKTVRSIAFSQSQDYSCLDKETTSEQQHSESRHSGEGVEASSVSGFSSMGREGSVGTRGDSRSGVVQGQSGGGSGTVRGRSSEVVRAFCPRGEGNGIDNSCGSGSGAKMAPDRDGGGSSSTRTSPGAGKPASVNIESQDSLDKAMSALGVSSVDDVVMIAGGNVRGAKVDIYGDESGFVKVSALWPIDRTDPIGGGKVFTEVSMGMTDEGKVLGFEAFGPSGGSVESPADQQTVISIISEKVAESINAAEESGFVAVTTFAVGDANNEYKGYRLWPQFGFDADLPRDLVKRIPSELILKSKGITIPAPGSTSIPHHLVVKSLASQHRDLTIQELIKTREGKRWWDDNGDDIALKLDLRDKESLGYKKWLDVKDRLPRLKSRNETRAFFDSWVQERGFCPTGEGGGIDNSCGNDDDGGPTDAFGGSIGGFERTPSAAKAKKGGGSSGPEERGPLVWRSGEPHIDIFRESTDNNPTTRDASGKVVATSIPGGVVTRALAGKYEVSPIAVGRYLMNRQAEERGRPISTREALEGDDFEYMVSSIADQATSAIARGVSPNFYSPEDRRSQLDEYSQLQPLMRGGRTASGVCIGDEDADGNCNQSEGIHPHAEFLFRAAQALTSPEANPYENMRRANEVLNSFFNEPDPKKARLGMAVDIAGASGDNIRNQLGRIQSIIDRIGLEETARLFSGPPVRVGDLDDYFHSRIPNSDGEVFQQKDYAVDEYAPPFSIFGPKVGPFFANNMGDPEPLTADVWFTRTWGRLSGELIEKTSPDLAKKHASQLMEQTGNIKRSLLAGIGQNGRTFRTDVAQMKKTGVIPQSVVNWAEKQFKQAEKDGFPGPDKGTGTAERKRLDNLAKAIIKNQTRVLKAPSTTVMRANMIRVMKEASARTGVPVAYLQDILWQDEQDAWGTLGSRTTTVPGEPSLYSTVIKKLVDDIKSGKPAKEEKPSRKKGKRSYDELDLDEDETGYLSDYKGGIEQALHDEAIHEVDEDTFADIAIEFLRRTQPESRSTLESAKEVVIELRSAGLNTILMPNAGRDGLHVMGFDADIPKDLADSLPESLSHCQTLLDLHVTGEGRSWWEQNGRDVDVTIDLDGIQGRIFDGFAAEKRWEDIIEEGILDDYGNS